MILNCFEIVRYIENELVGGFGHEISLIDYSINEIVLSMNNNCVDYEKLFDEIIKAFPQADFDFNVVGSELSIVW